MKILLMCAAIAAVCVTAQASEPIELFPASDPKPVGLFDDVVDAIDVENADTLFHVHDDCPQGVCPPAFRQVRQVPARRSRTVTRQVEMFTQPQQVVVRQPVVVRHVQEVRQPEQIVTVQPAPRSVTKQVPVPVQKQVTVMEPRQVEKVVTVTEMVPVQKNVTVTEYREVQEYVQDPPVQMKLVPLSEPCPQQVVMPMANPCPQQVVMPVANPCPQVAPMVSRHYDARWTYGDGSIQRHMEKHRQAGHFDLLRAHDQIHDQIGPGYFCGNQFVSTGGGPMQFGGKRGYRVQRNVNRPVMFPNFFPRIRGLR